MARGGGTESCTVGIAFSLDDVEVSTERCDGGADLGEAAPAAGRTTSADGAAVAAAAGVARTPLLGTTVSVAPARVGETVSVKRWGAATARVGSTAGVLAADVGRVGFVTVLVTGVGRVTLVVGAGVADALAAAADRAGSTAGAVVAGTNRAGSVGVPASTDRVVLGATVSVAPARVGATVSVKC